VSTVDMVYNQCATLWGLYIQLAVNATKSGKSHFGCLQAGASMSQGDDNCILHVGWLNFLENQTTVKGW